jgi:hypothetical protein
MELAVLLPIFIDRTQRPPLNFMPITFVADLDMDGNSIDNVQQSSSLNSVATVGKLETSLSVKANAIHVHDSADIQNIENLFQDITLDGGTL